MVIKISIIKISYDNGFESVTTNLTLSKAAGNVTRNFDLSRY